MKLLITTVIFISALTLGSYAQSDFLVVKLKNSQEEKIEISQIKRILFENITAVEELPVKPDLIENYPNPFSETTTIEFELQGKVSVNINIFSQTGELIRHIECPECTQGMNSYQWDCLNNSGVRVAEGVYFFEVVNGTERLSRKLVLVR